MSTQHHTRPFGREADITRVACDFPGCPAPPAVGGRGRLHISRYCSAHEKQLERTGVLKPVVFRSDLEERWEAWAEMRTSRHRGSGWLGLRHRGRCGGRMKVVATNPNKQRGTRYCWCSKCGRRVHVAADGSMRTTIGPRSRPV